MNFNYYYIFYSNYLEDIIMYNNKDSSVITYTIYDSNKNVNLCIWCNASYDIYERGKICKYYQCFNVKECKKRMYEKNNK